MDEKDLNDENMDTIVLTDENGDEIEFDLIATLDVNDNSYAVMIPAEDENGDAYIMRIETDDNGEEVFVGVDDDDEFNMVAEAYEELESEHDDEEDNDSDEDDDE